MKNKELFLVLLLTMVLVTAPILSVEASVNGSSRKLQIDLSNGITKNGYFTLPIDKSSDGLIFNLAYIAGYVDETSNDFIAYATRVLDSKEWYTKQSVNIPLNTKLVKINNIIVYSFRDQYHQEYISVPFQLNGREISVDFLFKGGRGTVEYVWDREALKETTLKDGDVLLPIYVRHTGSDKQEDVVQEDKKIVYNDKLFAMEVLADTSKLAFKIFGQSTEGDGHAYSDIIIPAKYSTNAATNDTSSPSTWAKPDIDKAKQVGLTTERVLKDYQKTITREEFCELAVNLYEKLSRKTAEPVSPNPFKDTDNIAVLKAYKLGIVSGTGNGEFSPDKPLNREQMAKMFFATLQLIYPNIGDAAEELSFEDKGKISIWAKQAVNYMYKEKIILGSNNQFNPQQEASREQALVLIYRVFEKFKL
jgi:hypothetical protein